MARHSTAPMPATRPASGVSGAHLAVMTVALVIGLVAVALVLTGAAEDAMGLLGMAMFFGTLILLSRRVWSQ